MMDPTATNVGSALKESMGIALSQAGAVNPLASGSLREMGAFLAPATADL